MKRPFHKIHLWLSVPVGIIISVICLTGAALVFEQDIIRALNPHLYKVERHAGAKPLKPSEVAARVKAQVPDSLVIASLQVSADPESTWTVSFSNVRRKTVSVNPYTGDITGWSKSYPFFQTMRQMHRWLMDVPPKKGDKTAGKAIVGISTLLMVVILVTGVVIWWPRTRKVLRNRLQVSYTKGWRRFWYDTHVSLGFYATIFLLVMALTGLTWSFSWYRTAAYGLFGVSTQRPAAAGVSADGKGGGGQDRPRGGHHGSKDKEKGGMERSGAQPAYTAWDKALTAVQAHYGQGFSSVRIENGKAQVTTSSEGSLRKTDTVVFNGKSGDITEITTSAQTPRQQKMKGWFYAFHTGSWGGWVTKILYFLAALIGGLLPLTGYYLWLKRTVRSRKQH